MGLRTRRGVLTTVTGVGVTALAGRGVRPTRAEGTRQEIPEWAHWLPSDERFLNDDGQYAPIQFDVVEMMQLLAQDDDGDDEDPPFLLIPPVFATLVAGFVWPAIGAMGIDQEVFGQSYDQAVENPDTSAVPADYHLLLGDNSVFAGSFDADAIASVIEGGDWEESSVSDVYINSDESTAITWGSSYLVLGARPEEVAMFVDAWQGEIDRAHETTPDFRRLLERGAGRDINWVVYAPDLIEGDGPDDPMKGSQGLVMATSFTQDYSSAETRVVIAHPQEGDVDLDALEGVLKQGTTTFSIEQDGRFVTAVGSFTDETPTPTPSPTPTPTPTPSPTPSPSPTPEPTETTAGDAPGMGVTTALAAIVGIVVVLLRTLDGGAE